ncbi:MAG: FIST signal transduction protein [Bacteroidia bacterium]
MLQFFSASARVVNTKRAVVECLEIALGESQLYNDVDLLVLHASIGHNFNEMVNKANELVPNATIVAASCCGVVGKEGVSESMKDMALMAIKGEEFAVAHTPEINGSNSYENTLKMAHELKAKNPNVNMIYTLASGIDIANDQAIRAIEQVFGPDVTIFGATSSDNMKGIINYQAYNTNVFEHGAYLVGFADPTLKIETQATHGFVAIGEPLEVTKSTGHIIHEFNGKPAWQEYTKRLAIDAENPYCSDSIPIGALAEELPPARAQEYGNQHILRVVTSHSGNDMYYATNCQVGTKLWLTTRDEDLIFTEMDKMVNEMKERIDGEPVAVFHADCLARGRFLFGRVIKDELVSKMQNPFFVNGECPAWLGMYGFGEFARLGGQNEYHNYTTALYVIYR